MRFRSLSSIFLRRLLLLLNFVPYFWSGVYFVIHVTYGILQIQWTSDGLLWVVEPLHFYNHRSASFPHGLDFSYIRAIGSTGRQENCRIANLENKKKQIFKSSFLNIKTVDLPVWILYLSVSLCKIASWIALSPWVACILCRTSPKVAWLVGMRSFCFYSRTIPVCRGFSSISK